MMTVRCSGQHCTSLHTSDDVYKSVLVD